MQSCLRVCALVVLLVLSCGTLAAQNGTVKGKITDAGTGQDLAGATVSLFPPNATDRTLPLYGAISKAGGMYQINEVAAGSYMLRVTFVGYRTLSKSIEVRAGQDLVVDVAVTQDAVNLDELVVVGAASRTTKSVAEVAVARVDATELLRANTYQDVTQLLAGKVPGVGVSPASGNVGGGVRFDVRSGGGLFGSGQPTIYLDGARINTDETGFFYVGGQNNSSLFDVPTEDLSSIEVLKGPSAAALYGTGGSNGVILLSSRESKLAPGEPLSLVYKGTVGYNEQRFNYSRDDLLSFADVNATFRKGYFNQHSVTLGGSNDMFGYSVAWSSRLENGIMNNSKGERQAIHATFEAEPGNFYVRSSVYFTGSTLRRPQNDNNILGYLGNTMIFAPSVDSTGAETSNSYIFLTHDAIDAINTQEKAHRFIASAIAEYHPIDRLALNATVGFDGSDAEEVDMYPTNFDYSSVGITAGQRGLFNNSWSQYNVELNAAYNYDIMDRFVGNTIVGMQLFETSVRNFYIQKQEFSSNLVTNVGAGATFLDGNEGEGNTRESGVFFQEELNYRNTYFASFGVRNDFASSFGDEAPSIIYPRASAAVRLDKLDLLPSMVNFMKVRMAYGQSGQLPRPADGDALRWGSAESGFGAGAVITSVGNVKIEPERIAEFEAGLEFQFDSAYSADFTYYRQTGTNSIIGFVNAPSTGLTATSVPTNIGEITGSGIELELIAAPIRTKDLEFTADLIVNTQNNEVKDMGGAQPIFNNANVITVGLPRSGFFLPTVVGAELDSDGMYAGPKFAKLDSAGEPVNEFQGNPVPTMTGSIALTLKVLKNITLYALGDWATGQTVFNQTRQFNNDERFGNNSLEKRKLDVQLGLVPPDAFGPLGVQPLTPGSAEYKTAADRYAHLETTDQTRANWLEPGDFFCIREISLGYDASDLIESFMPGYIRSLSVAVSVRNLALFTKYSGADPQVNDSGARTIERGTDFLTLQSPRTLNLTLEAGF